MPRLAVAGVPKLGPGSALCSHHLSVGIGSEVSVITTFRRMLFSSRACRLRRRRHIELRLIYLRVQFDLRELSGRNRIANLDRRSTRYEGKLDSVYVTVIFKVDLLRKHANHSGRVSDAAQQ